MKKLLGVLLVTVLTGFATGATANQIVYQLQISGLATNGYSYTGTLDFNTSAFAAFNGSFAVTIPGAGVITMNYQAPVPENHSTWCDAYQNPWCDLTQDWNHISNEYFPVTYFLIADRPGPTSGGLYDQYAFYFHLNDLDPLSPVQATLIDRNSAVFSADWRPDGTAPHISTATEVITLLGTYEVSGRGNSIPEPTSLALVGLCLAVLGLSRRKLKKQ